MLGRPVDVEQLLDLFSDLTHENYYEDIYEQEWLVEGWAFDSRGPVKIEVLSGDSPAAGLYVEYKPSTDVYDHFNRQGLEFEAAKFARFSVQSACNDDCRLVFTSPDSETVVVPLKQAAERSGEYNSDGTYIYIDSISYKTREQRLPSSSAVNRIKINILDMIMGVYRKMIPPLSLAALLLYLKLCMRVFRRLDSPDLWIVLSGLLGSILTMVMILALITASSASMYQARLFAAVQPLLLIFAFLSLFYGIQLVLSGLNTRSTAP